MRKVLAGIIVVVILLVVVDVASKVMAEKQLTDKAQQGVPAGATVDAHIHSLPFLGRIAVNGRIDEVDFHMTRVKEGPLTYPVIDVQLAGVRINRHKLLSDQQVRLVSIESGRLSTQLRAEDISTALNQRVVIRNGRLYVDVAGREVEVKPKVDRGKTLTLTAAGVASLALELPQNDLLPCAADVAIGSSTIEIACSISQVPQPLIAAANAVVGG